jgi:hypothetical protein
MYTTKLPSDDKVWMKSWNVDTWISWLTLKDTNHGFLHSLKDCPMVKDIILLDTWSMKLDMPRIIWELKFVHLLNKEARHIQQILEKDKGSMSIGFYKWKFQATNLEWYFRTQVKFGPKDHLCRPKFGACVM